eukprot:gene146-4392_t
MNDLDFETEVRFENEKGEFVTDIGDEGADEVYQDLKDEDGFDKKDEDVAWSETDERNFMKKVVPNLENFIKHLGIVIKEENKSKYVIDDDCLDNLDNLIESLKGDSNGRMRKHLGELKIIQHDLTPLLKVAVVMRDYKIAKRVVDLLNYLTKLPSELNQDWNHHLTRHLQLTKEIFVRQGNFSPIPISLGEQMLMERPDKHYLGSILQFIQNILSISSFKQSTDNQFILVLKKENVLDLLIPLIQKYGNLYSKTFIEIISLLLKNETAESLYHTSYSILSTGVKLNKPNRHTKEAFREIINKEKEEKLKKGTINRHSRFGGVIVKNKDEEQIVYHLVDGKQVERSHKINKRMKIHQPHKVELKIESPAEIKVALKKFVESFRTDCFNDFCSIIFTNLRNSANQDIEYHFLHVLGFTFAYNRLLNNFEKFEISYVSDMMDDSLISWIFQKISIDSGVEGYIQGKKWNNLKVAISTLKELFYGFNLMLQVENLKDIGEKHLLNCFYDNDDSLNISRLIGLYDATKAEKELLFDLIDLSHEMYSIIKNNQIFVKRKKKEGEEISLQTSTFLNGYSKTSVIKNYILALKLYETNTLLINECIVSMLSLIMDELDMGEKLFHISILRVCSDILHDDSISKKPEFQKMITLADMIVERFLFACEKNDMLYIHCLFWKTSAEAIHIQQQTREEQSRYEAYDSDENEYDFPERGDEEFFAPPPPQRKKRSKLSEKKEPEERKKRKSRFDIAREKQQENKIDEIFSEEEEEVQFSDQEKEEKPLIVQDDEEEEYDFGDSIETPEQKENSNDNSDENSSKKRKREEINEDVKKLKTSHTPIRSRKRNSVTPKTSPVVNTMESTTKK